MSFKKTATTLSKGAKTLGRKYYTSKKILDKEYETLFYNDWICAGRSSELSNIGQYKTINIGKESIIILRDNNNKIVAHYNVCRHRGTRICNHNSGQFSKSIQCGYHGWTYDLNGNLIGAPHMDAVTNFNKDNYSLHHVALKEWEGFIFINLSNKPSNFEIYFSPILNRFKQWNISTLKTLETKRYDVEGNWKLVIQNYCECYHCPILHPDLAAIHNYMGGRNDLYEGPFLGGYMDFSKNKNSITKNGELCSPILPQLEEKNKRRVYYYSIFPNMLLSLHPEYVMFHTVWPNGNKKSIVECSWLFEEEVINSNKYQPEDAINFWDMTNKQDWYISELSQLGIQSKKYTPAPYSGQESLLAAFDSYYLEQFK